MRGIYPRVSGRSGVALIPQGVWCRMTIQLRCDLPAASFDLGITTSSNTEKIWHCKGHLV